MPMTFLNTICAMQIWFLYVKCHERKKQKEKENSFFTHKRQVVLENQLKDKH